MLHKFSAAVYGEPHVHTLLFVLLISQIIYILLYNKIKIISILSIHLYNLYLFFGYIVNKLYIYLLQIHKKSGLHTASRILNYIHFFYQIDWNIICSSYPDKLHQACYIIRHAKDCICRQ